MKLSGSVEVEVVDSVTGELKQHIKQTNLIPDNTLIEILNWNATRQFFGIKRISISAQQITPSPLNNTLTQILATGYIPASVESPTWNETLDPPFGQIQNRIDPIGMARDFYTIGLTDLGNNNKHPDGTQAITSAYVKLDTVCTQGATDVVNIFYRIQFDNAGGQGLTNRARYNFGKELFIRHSEEILFFPLSALWNSPKEITNLDSVSVLTLENLAGFRDAFGVTGWTQGIRIDNHFKWKYVFNKGKNELVGLLIHSFVQGFDDAFKGYSSTRFENPQEPFQTGFWHSSNAPGPFFDSSFSGTSQGEIELSGMWTGTTPQLYKITITTSGAVGVATYRLSIADIPNGFNGNTWQLRRTNQQITWVDYGWNNTTWVVGSGGNRLTHATEENLLNGLKIKFTNASQPPHFTATDFFTQAMCIGLLKDNATDIFWQSCWYSRPTQFDAKYTELIPATTPPTLLLPAAADPDFIRIETDQLEYHDFKINGLPVLNIYLDTPPGPQEVSLASDGKGTVLFHSSDAGKTFDATYTWIKR